MVRRGMSTPCLHTTPTTTTVFPTQTIQREEGMWAQLGIVPQTHQSCLTSPAVPALLLIILSTVNDSYSAPIIPLNVTLFDYSSFSHHWTTVIPATVIPTTGPLTFLFIGRLSFQAIGPVSFLYIEPLLFKSVVSLPFKHAKPLPFLPTGLSFLHWTNHLNLLYDSNSCLFVDCHSWLLVYSFPSMGQFRRSSLPVRLWSFPPIGQLSLKPIGLHSSLPIGWQSLKSVGRQWLLSIGQLSFKPNRWLPIKPSGWQSNLPMGRLLFKPIRWVSFLPIWWLSVV